jgi:hypothetical protein
VADVVFFSVGCGFLIAGAERTLLNRWRRIDDLVASSAMAITGVIDIAREKTEQIAETARALGEKTYLFFLGIVWRMVGFLPVANRHHIALNAEFN